MPITQETRCASYRAVMPKAAKRREIIMSILRGRTMTASEIAETLYLRGFVPYPERNYAAPRLTELQQAGKVEVVGKRFCAKTGRMIAIWAVKKKEG